jgi:hypothetical protein
MTTLREAAQMALDALEHGLPIIEDFGGKEQLQIQHKAIAVLYEALRAALAQQEPVATLFGSLPVYDVPTKQEPVAWMHNFIDEVVIAHRPVDLNRHPDRWTALYKDPTPCQTCEALARTVMMDQTSHDAPPQREWQGLTDEEMMVAAFQAGFDVHEDYDNEDDPDALHWWSEDGEPCDDTLHKLRDIIEAKLKEKNGL